MTQSRTLNTLLTGASAAMIALSSLAQVLVQQKGFFPDHPFSNQMWLMILTTTTATLLVMSVLQGNLDEMYKEITKKAARAREDALTDSLTSLGNRKFLIKAIEERTDPAVSRGDSALLFLDLDHFKRVNDTLGHAAGDQLIVEVAERLRNSAPGATIGRLGGDEFAIIIDETGKEGLAQFCEDCVNSLAGTYQVGGAEVFIGISIGAVMFDQNLTTSDLMRRADVAMYKAKANRNGYKIFDDEMIRSIERRVALESRLRADLRSGQNLSGLFLPQVDLTGTMIGLELLVRWNDSEYGPIPPPEIISIAEDAGLISDIGLFLTEQACEAASALPDQLVCLNIATKQLLDGRFADQLAALVGSHGLMPERFQLDIPEVVLVKRGEEIRPTLEKLAKAGFRLAADDFGTSTSSLNYLQNLGITAIKLDRSLLQDAVDLGTIAVMRAIVGLARSLQLSVTCEGISSQAEKSAALQAGCDYLQGFFFGKPIPLRDLLHSGMHAIMPDMPAVRAGQRGSR
jgi:diguanylate cyclase (GGDEF)-like protein